MLFLLKRVKTSKNQWKQMHDACGPPRGPKKECACKPSPHCIPPPPKPPHCLPGPMQANPCCPQPPHGENTSKKFKLLFFFGAIPLILIQYFVSSGHHIPPKGECRDYEYMRRRTKRFPWGDGVKSLFHNDEVNHLPGECTPPPPDDCE